MKQVEAKQYNNAKMWQIGFFSLNNCATNIAMFLMMQYSYFTQNVLGLAAAIIGIIATGTRIFDAITDPLVGFLVDRTNGRFGKFRPYMLIGNVIIWSSLIVIFNTPADWSTSQKYVMTTVFYIIYILGYTCQTVVTKAGQAVLTNNPKQRPVFAGFDSVLTQMASALVPMLITTILAEKYSVGRYLGEGGKELGIINPDMWKEAVLILAFISFTFTILAMIGISQKDRPEFFGQAGSQPKVKFRDYKDIVVHNRPIQMLIISAATDKLGQLLMSGTMTYVFANMLLNTKLQGVFSSVLIVPLVAISIGGVFVSGKFGLKRTFLLGTWGSMIMLAVMFVVRPNPSMPVIFLGMLLVQKCLASMGNSGIIPMIADCTDYETYRSGRFVPGMMGTMFSFIDKIVSSFSAMIQGFALTLAGVGNVVITPNEPVNGTFNTAIMVCFCIIPILGHVATIIAMKWYHLDKEKMAEIQETLEARKAA
ncbi:MAG: MFS transporter [Hungatella hathewayi]|nr:MFS transporter [Hungatella hathewayi]